MLGKRQPVPDRVRIALVIRILAEVAQEMKLEALDTGSPGGQTQQPAGQILGRQGLAAERVRGAEAP